MGPYTKKFNRAEDVWEIYGNSAGEDEEPVLDDLLGTLQTESLAQILIACLSQGLDASDIESLPNCFSTTTDAQMRADLFDAAGNQVAGFLGNARTVALECFAFIYLHGGDPDANGACAQPGNIEFGPPDAEETHG